MPLNPDEIAAKRFSSVRKSGYDPDEVHAFLAELAASLRDQDGDGGFSKVGDQVATVLQSANESAAEIVAKAEKEADDLLADARAELVKLQAEAAHAKAEADEARTAARGQAKELIGDAESYALTSRTSAEEYALDVRTKADEYAQRTRAGADGYGDGVRAEADEYMADARQKAEDSARAHSKTVLSEAQERLDNMLATESLVRERIQLAMSDLQQAAQRVSGELPSLDLTDADADGHDDSDAEPPPSDSTRAASRLWEAAGNAITR